MLSAEYVVESIDGDYARLLRTDEPAEGDNATKLVARALLPAEITEGSRLKYEMMEYSLIG
ncbi:MAG: chorismate--pyruvate lyase [Lachnospiraceae bacterium]|nr:chorismate--pyruvate lyase [Lachnospiraceae bacterium]